MPTAPSPLATDAGPVAFTPRERLVRFVFRRCMKDKTLKALTRRFWPVMRVTIEGHRFALHPADNTTEFRLFTDGRLDERVSLAALLERVANRACTVLDIGANCGVYTVPLAAAGGDGARVLAFEPSPVMAARLEANVALNGLGARVEVHRVALGAERGRATLHVHPKNHGQSSLRALDAERGSVAVERAPLADFTADLPAGVPLIVKIDVEGREDDVLCPFLDAVADASLPEAILLEMVLETSWRRDLRGALTARGYRVALEADGNALFVRGDAAPA